MTTARKYLYITLLHMHVRAPTAGDQISDPAKRGRATRHRVGSIEKNKNKTILIITKRPRFLLPPPRVVFFHFPCRRLRFNVIPSF